MADVDIDTELTLYKMNKDLVKEEPAFTNKQLKKSLKNIVRPFLKQCPDQYFMLLCREQYDFTLFNFIDKEKTDFSIEKSLKDFFDCLINRGSVISIDLTEPKDAVEIWIRTEEDSFCYYLFPYDLGVIEVKI